MKNTKSVAGVAGIIALAAAAIGINALIPAQSTEKEADLSKLAQASSITIEVANAPEYSGDIVISDLSVPFVSSSNEAGLKESTGKTSIPVAGMSNVLINATSISKDKVASATEALDVATKYVPEGSIIAGYTNLGVSDVRSYLNVRKGPGTEHKIIGKMPGGSACEIVETLDGWYKIKSGDVTGYVSADYILTGYAANVKAMETMETKLLVTARVLNVREEPSTECLVSTAVCQGEYLEILEEENNGWYKIDINNLEGYVSAAYVERVNYLPVAVEIVEVKASTTYKNNNSGTGSNSGGNKGSGSNSGSSSNTYTKPSFDVSTLDQTVSQTASDLIQYAMQFLGNPYVLGGNSLTNGTDCSGFTKLIFAHYGYTLPRCAGDYAYLPNLIPYTAAKPGDILLYDYGRGVGHVAIYIGNGQIIHASTPRGGIKISTAYFVTPCAALRVLP